MNTAYSRLKELIDEGYEPEDAADALIAETDCAELQLFARPYFLYDAIQIARYYTRKIEQEVDEAIAEGEEPAVAYQRFLSDPISERKRLREDYFQLPDGSSVNWLDATIEDHLLRAKWQEGLADNIMEDVKRHRLAAAQIEAAGVTCLRDLL